MKVLLLNGSPHKEGCTYTALAEVAKGLAQQGVESEILHVGGANVSGCMACGGCRKTGKCVFNNDEVNAVAERIEEYSGFVVGSPVHYAAASGAITSFLDRLFYICSSKMALKPGAAIVSCRRAGTSATLDQLNKYFTIANMPVVSSQYWNMVHGSTPEEVKKDEEGLQTMRVLGRNMAWLIRSIEAGKNAGIAPPEREERKWTNFIR
ncbi:MAG: flavodoxin family protein [Clostridia bacterium]|nr:flavodoxin family protein [Clostridia bacterium]